MATNGSDPAGDRQQIIDLTIAYCWALDGHQWAELDQVFLPDATASLGGTFAGLEAIKARVEDALGKLDSSQHMVANHQVTVDGDRATSRCYLHAQHVRKGATDGPNYIVAGRYEDQLVRTAEGWRIAQRNLITMWTDGNPGVVRGDR